MTVHPGVQDGVDDHAELHLELLHAHRLRVALAGIARVGEGYAAIHHHPFALRAVQVDVHADLA